MKLNKKNIWVNIGALISILLIIYCVVYIYNYYTANDIFWHYPKNINTKSEALSPNEIGDSIGGILNPVIGLVASILTFLAFYMQKRANDEIQEQFKTQQFESQFYEMLHLHKENVDELKAMALLDGREVQRRQVFETMANEFSTMLSYIQAANFDLTQDDIENCYHIFFWGYNIPERQNLSADAQRWLRLEGVQSNTPMINFSNHRGFSASLGHYFRHLYMMVKFVAESKVVIEYDTKMKYLKILRAQLSNHEQIMLFYNWLSTYGSAWEEENGNHFFTEYKMIHNLWIGELYQHQFIVNKVNNLIDRYNQNPKSTPLFEFQQNNFNLKMNDIENKPLSEIQF